MVGDLAKLESCRESARRTEGLHRLGASQGVITIVRGAVPLALFGVKGYGAVLGVIATPILIVNAFSPAIFAVVAS